MKRHKKKSFKKRGQLKSGLEIRINKELNKRKLDYNYEGLFIRYRIEKKYWPDFAVWNKQSGDTTFLEVKGYFKYEDQVKMRAVKEANPNLDIRMVFDKDNKIPRSNMRYSDWCKKYGFPYCVGSIPKEWFE